ncbi:protease inhibitor I9 family protein [Janthinobacterium sp. NKUCC06_STL]|uniref:protease inhibitor I9 family protein n=1 Tax=Janthinobacterium sp. NKUCC06_STL TaxID=2842127 RepID=UPI001C5BC4E7|nr:protease inhibitor I9 family protein [Janthinobacterium sp. NKUCC06_STL]MBW3512459.1 protease inhibitor I9 family protein [Janthinobacterium sp. NKUCC06_STL]
MSAIRFSLAILAAASVLPAGAAAAQRQLYIVQLSMQLPTPPDAVQREGQRQAQREADRRAVLALVPDATVQYHTVQYQYTAALNGFAALLTPDEVTRLRASPLVARVAPGTEDQINGGGTHLTATPRPQH